VVDADLSILGTDDATFDQYERDVREEYAMFDDATYRAGRRRVLEAFLGRSSIFSTPRARELWEARARANLARSLERT
jgi:predicted metal-dependent HD superfamily phosphohydrolase